MFVFKRHGISLKMIRNYRGLRFEHVVQQKAVYNFSLEKKLQICNLRGRGTIKSGSNKVVEEHPPQLE